MKSEIIESFLYQEPSPRLFELLQFIQDREHDLDRLCGIPVRADSTVPGWELRQALNETGVGTQAEHEAPKT